MAGSDHDVRLAAVGGQNGERAFKHAGHAAHSLEQVWLAFVRDNLVHDLAEQLSGHLSVGGRGESVAFGLQVETQLRGVFDDAVMDDGHLAVHAGVRVGVHVARLAIGGPARVADAHRGKRHRLTLDVFDQVLQTAGLLAHDHLIHAGRGQRHTGRVIASVFQTFQPCRQTSKGLPHAVSIFPAYPTIPHMVHQPSGRLLRKANPTRRLCRIGTCPFVKTVH